MYHEWLDGFASVDEAVEVLSAARVPVVPMLSPEELVEHPQMKVRQAFPEVEHRGSGRVRVTATPFHVDGKPTHPKGSAPYRIGEKTREVLMGLPGYTEEKIDALRKSGVIELPD